MSWARSRLAVVCLSVSHKQARSESAGLQRMREATLPFRASVDDTASCCLRNMISITPGREIERHRISTDLLHQVFTWSGMNNEEGIYIYMYVDVHEHQQSMWVDQWPAVSSSSLQRHRNVIRALGLLSLPTVNRWSPPPRLALFQWRQIARMHA